MNKLVQFIHSVAAAEAKINFEFNKANKCSQAYQAIECRIWPYLQGHSFILITLLEE